jgi:hypothetical protein
MGGKHGRFDRLLDPLGRGPLLGPGAVDDRAEVVAGRRPSGPIVATCPPPGALIVTVASSGTSSASAMRAPTATTFSIGASTVTAGREAATGIGAAPRAEATAGGAAASGAEAIVGRSADATVGPAASSGLMLATCVTAGLKAKVPSSREVQVGVWSSSVALRTSARMRESVSVIFAVGCERACSRSAVVKGLFRPSPS